MLPSIRLLPLLLLLLTSPADSRRTHTKRIHPRNQIRGSLADQSTSASQSDSIVVSSSSVSSEPKSSSSYWEEQVLDGNTAATIAPSPAHTHPPKHRRTAPSPAVIAVALSPAVEIEKEMKIEQVLSKLNARIEGSKTDEAKNAALKAEMPGGGDDAVEGPEPGSPAADAMASLGKIMASAGPTMGEMIGDMERKNDEQNIKDV